MTPVITLPSQSQGRHTYQYKGPAETRSGKEALPLVEDPTLSLSIIGGTFVFKCIKNLLNTLDPLIFLASDVGRRRRPVLFE